MKENRMAVTFAQLENTPLGPLSFVAGEKGLRGVGFMSLNVFKQMLNCTDEAPSLKGFTTLSMLLVQVNAYLDGLQSRFSVDIDWGVVDGFQEQVLRLTAVIPFGQVSTYGAIAKQLGKPGAARAVGAALGQNPMPIVIPCHRVIGTDNTLHGYSGGEQNKAFLLALEGHAINNHQVFL
jgi:methylated-DNA-[protein]-cysteine S-methyltransferase